MAIEGDLGVEEGADKDELIRAIALAEARVEMIKTDTLAKEVSRLRALQALLLELEALEAEPNLLN